MLKAAVVLGVPGVLGGIGLMYNGQGMPTGPEPPIGAYLAEVGVAFPEGAVRAALPEGLEPAPGFTGGIAIYGGQEGWAGSPFSAGYVWVDAEASGTPVRYLLKDPVSERYEDSPADVIPAVALSEVHDPKDGVLQVTARPDRVSGLELVVRPSSETCIPGAEKGELLTSGPDGRLDAIQAPAVDDWCLVEADVAWAGVVAPFGHMLRPFVAHQVLWAQIATPPQEGMPDLTGE